MKIPYFAQWESRTLVETFLKNPDAAVDDPLWQNSGASDRNDYAHWAQHLCGMACLKMALAYRDDEIHKTVHLAKACTKYGGYKVGWGSPVKGLYYKPFTEFIEDEFNLHSTVLVDVGIDRILDEIKGIIYLLRPFILPSDHRNASRHRKEGISYWFLRVKMMIIFISITPLDFKFVLRRTLS